MKVTISVDLGEGAFDVTTNLYTVVQWERRFKRKASEMASAIGMEDIAYLAYEACKWNKITVPSEFDTFLKTLVSLELVDQEDENPTQPGPTATA